jgi:hypothetical protein
MLYMFTVALLRSHYPLTTASFNKTMGSPATPQRKPRKWQKWENTQSMVYKPYIPRDVNGTKFCGVDLPNIGFCFTCAVWSAWRFPIHAFQRATFVLKPGWCCGKDRNLAKATKIDFSQSKLHIHWCKVFFLHGYMFRPFASHLRAKEFNDLP